MELFSAIGICAWTTPSPARCSASHCPQAFRYRPNGNRQAQLPLRYPHVQSGADSAAEVPGQTLGHGQDRPSRADVSVHPLRIKTNLTPFVAVLGATSFAIQETFEDTTRSDGEANNAPGDDGDQNPPEPRTHQGMFFAAGFSPWLQFRSCIRPQSL